jgi:tRNA threonylcarbamoyl adenosine modification protein (Sua5/YciO/YrdC/YwlC family)
MKNNKKEIRMEYYELHPEDPQLRYINKAVDVLKNGGIVIYPTDTVYGMGCDIYNKKSLEKLFRIKNDSREKLFSFICSGFKEISKYAKISDYAYKRMKHLLPGPYTFILPTTRLVPKELWSKRKRVGIRIPDNNVALRLVEELGNPIVSTSATNRKGEILYDPFEIKNIFNSQVDLMLGSGILAGNPSSVIDLSEDVPEILRQGAGDIALFV